jgi:hypothetical protein
LARAAVRFRDAAFWRYHREGLKTLGQTLDVPHLALQIVWELLGMAANPGMSVAQAYRYWKRSGNGKRAPQMG